MLIRIDTWTATNISTNLIRIEKQTIQVLFLTLFCHFFRECDA